MSLDPAPLDAIIHQAVAAGVAPGAVAIAVDRDGVLFEGAAGRRDVGRPDPMTPDTVVWLASMTKAITCTAALQLVERGRLALDAPIGAVLPELAAPQVLTGWSADGVPLLRPATRPLTLRHLMSHTSGFCYDMWNATHARYMREGGIPSSRTCKLAALGMPLMREPGTEWEYGIGIDVVGRAVEAASGERLDRYLARHVFEPLGMRDTTFLPDADQLARRATVHARGEDGGFTATDFAMPTAVEFHMGGGGLYGTAADYGRFMRMLLNGGALDGARILGPDAMRLMGENQIGELSVRPLPSTSRRASHDVDLFPGVSKKWSLGFMITETALPGGRGAGALSWAGLANTYQWVDRAGGVAGALLTQVMPFADPRILDLLGAFERAVYGAVRPAAAA